MNDEKSGKDGSGMIATSSDASTEVSCLALEKGFCRPSVLLNIYKLYLTIF
jgi:hypothetical protein